MARDVYITSVEPGGGKARCLPTARRGGETVSIEWLAERLRDFIDLNPEFETPIERLATWLARLEDDED